MTTKLAPYGAGGRFDIDRPQLGFFDTIGQGINAGLERTSLGLLDRYRPYWNDGTKVRREQFDRFYAGRGIDYDPHMRLQEIHATLDAQSEARAEADLLEQSTFGGKAGYLVGNFLGGIPDPVNLIGVGEGMMAINLGRAFLKGAAINAALEVPFSAAEYNLRNRQQIGMGAGDLGMNFAMAAGLGGLFGALGHGVERLRERSRVFNIGYGLDREGKVVKTEVQPTPLEPRTEPIEQAVQRGSEIDLDQDEVKIIDLPLPGGGRTKVKVVDGEARTLRDEEYYAARGGVKVKEETLRDGTKRVFDPETGEILRETRDYTPRGIGKSNERLAKEIQSELDVMKQANPDKPWKRTDKKTGKVTQGTSEGLRMVRLDQVVDGKLRQAARDRTRTERLDEQNEPDGVLVARSRKGARGTIKELGLRDWWRRTLSRARIKSRDVRSFRKGNIVERRVLERMGVLNREQFDWVVDHVAQMRMLRGLASDAKIRVNPEATRRELGDLLWKHLRGHDPWSRIPDLNKRKQRTPSYTKPIDPAETIDDLNAELLRQRIEALYKDRELLDADEYVDREQTGVEITTDNLRDELEKRAGRFRLDELAQRSPEVAQILKRADTMKVRRDAMRDAFVCLLGVSK